MGPVTDIVGVDLDFDVKSTGVDMDTDAWAMDTNVPVDDNAILIDGLEQQDPTEGASAVPTSEPTTSPKKVKRPVKKAASPKMGMEAQNSWVRKAPEKYVPSMKGNKYAIALTQITLALQGSKDALCMAQRLVKMMGKGLHRCADIVGMVMAQVSMKAALKKWGKAAEQTITIKMKQLHWRNLYKPMHWHDFHTIVAKALYVTKRARPDISLAIAFLTRQVRSPDTENWEKLHHLLEYLRGDRDRPFILGADNEGMLMWYVNASFAVHPNMCGHTSGGMTIGRGFPISVSTKQKFNTKSLTESDLVSIDDMMLIILCTCYFLLSQGYGVIENLLLQDN